MQHEISRRAILSATPVLLAGVHAGLQAPRKLKVVVFSKHLQFLRNEELAETVARIGFDGVDLTVRNGGHVQPERVAQDLPRLATIILQRGLDLPMITTDIVDADTPFDEDIVKTMAQLDIRRYRWAGFHYVADLPYASQLEQMRIRTARLAALNARYDVCAMYQTESGIGQVGASVCSLPTLLSGLNPHHVGVNYDVGHATIEGGLGGWINSFQTVRPYIRGVAIKDFIWLQDPEKLTWQPRWQPINQGMVRLPEFFAMVARSDFSGPVQLHFEHLPRATASSDPKVTFARGQIFDAMKQDLGRIRKHLAECYL